MSYLGICGRRDESVWRGATGTAETPGDQVREAEGCPGEAFVPTTPAEWPWEALGLLHEAEESPGGAPGACAVLGTSAGTERYDELVTQASTWAPEGG